MTRRIAFAWPGLPDYAARCIRKVIERHDGPVDVIATRPTIPIEGMERSLGQAAYWVEDGAGPPDLPLPDVIFSGGYVTPIFNRLTKRVTSAGGTAVLMSDNNWTGSMRQWLVEPIRHRLLFRRRYDAAFVPGAAAARLARRWGYPPARVVQGLYGADPALFTPGPPLDERPREFLFIGQFIARKGILPLLRAFARFSDAHPGWRLRVCGSGPLRDALPAHHAITIESFVQPSELATLLRRSRVLVLPSLDEHWGLVVHEAALSGCALMLSDAVGAASDLAGRHNAVCFRPGDEAAIVAALETMAVWTPAQWQAASSHSVERAAHFSPDVFADAALRLVALS